MKQREIKLGRDHDETTVNFDENLYKTLSGHYNKLHLAASFLLEQLKSGKLSVGFKNDTLGLLEAYLIDFNKSFGFESALEKQRKERYAEIKSLNEENHALRKQLGEKITNDEFAEKSKNLGDSIKRWWNISGIGFMKEEKFTTYGSFSAKLSGHISDGYYGKDEEYEDGSQKRKRLEQLGFKFASNDFLIDTDSNKDLLIKFLTEKYPSLKITEYNIQNYDRVLVIRDIEIIIQDLTDIK
jgi:hypothetical protein